MSDTGDDWDVTVRPRTLTIGACVAAAVIALAGIGAAIPLKHSTTGAYFRTADQFAIAGIAFVIAGGLLLLTRPRVKVGPSGLLVRNLLEDKLIPWSDVVDVSFPKGKRWARIDLDYDEYCPIVAIQAVDRERAVEAMDSVRTLMGRYRT